MNLLADFFTHGLTGLLLQRGGKEDINVSDFSQKINKLIDAGMTFLT